ncbi:hypothetical protein GALL_373130 [mine drainage metagenome]|uniref:Uncharacterized protein n=1 Tax=mine drainage metagenome TaxID=410659 RepID=A0A1J5QBY0_9ZZZZ
MGCLGSGRADVPRTVAAHPEVGARDEAVVLEEHRADPCGGEHHGDLETEAPETDDPHAPRRTRAHVRGAVAVLQHRGPRARVAGRAGEQRRGAGGGRAGRDRAQDVRLVQCAEEGIEPVRRKAVARGGRPERLHRRTGFGLRQDVDLDAGHPGQSYRPSRVGPDLHLTRCAPEQVEPGPQSHRDPPRLCWSLRGRCLRGRCLRGRCLRAGPPVALTVARAVGRWPVVHRLRCAVAVVLRCVVHGMWTGVWTSPAFLGKR